MARYLTKIELKYGILTTLVSVTACEIRKLCFYTMFAMEVHVVLSTMVGIQVVVDLESNMRLRAHIVDLQ